MEEKIDLPEKGIVVGFELENLEDYLNCTEHLVQVHGKFEVLAEIEKKVKYEKIRHLAKFLMTEYNPELKRNVVFRLSKFKERHEHNGETVYIVIIGLMDLYHFRKYRERLLRFLSFFFQVQQKETTLIHLGPV